MSLLDYILDDDNNIKPEVDKLLNEQEQEETDEQEELEEDESYYDEEEDPSLSIRELTPEEVGELFNSI